jgi:hypothetical protein
MFANFIGFRQRRLTTSVVLLAVVLLISLIVRIRLIDAPFERDEGEHAYIAQTMRDGNPPWKLACNMKLPGSELIYTLAFAIFGEEVWAVRLALLAVNTLSILLVVLLGKRLAGAEAGLLAGSAYGILTFSQNVVGTTFHSTHMVALLSLTATMLLVRPVLRRRTVLSAGLCYGMAFLMKQPGLAFAGFGAVYLLWRLYRDRIRFRQGAVACALFGIGVASPYAILCLILWKDGVFEKFWFWTVTLVGVFATQRPLAIQAIFLRKALPQILLPNAGLWILAAGGLILAASYRPTRLLASLVGVLFVFSAAAVSAGGVFSSNYFIQLFPAVALALAAGYCAGRRLWEGWLPRLLSKLPHPELLQAAQYLPLAIFALACLTSIYVQRHYLFGMDTLEFERSSYGLNPFPEAREVGRYLAAHSSQQAKIAVLGSEAEIYFYARRQSATGIIFMYGLMEPSQYDKALQREMIREIETARPEYMVWVRTPESWLERPGASLELFQWAEVYLQDHFETVGIVDIRSDRTDYRWGPEARRFMPTNPNFIQVMRRKDLPEADGRRSD